MDKYNINNTGLPSDDSGKIDLSEIFWRYFSHWRWILLSVFITLCIGYFYSKMQTAVYQIGAAVLIKSPDKSDNSLLKDLGIENTANLENEAEIFKSKRLLVGVVDSLGLNTSYFYKTILNRRVELYRTTPLEVKVSKENLQSLGNQTMIMTFVNSGSNFDVEIKLGEKNIVQHYSTLPSTIHTPIGIVRVKAKKAKFELIRPLVVMVQSTKSVIGSIYVQSFLGKKNEIITLTSNSLNQQKGVDVLTRLIDSYNADAMKQLNQSALNTAAFIEERLRLLSIELSQVERKVEDYKRSNQFTDISSEATDFNRKRRDIENNDEDKQLQLKLVSFVEDFISDNRTIYSPIPDVNITDNGLSNMIKSYNDLLVKRMRLMESSSLDNPVLNTLMKRLSELRKTLLLSLKNNKKIYNFQQANLLNNKNKALDKLQDITRQVREFSELERQQKIKEQLYMFLLQKREESALTMALTVPKAIVINEAEVQGMVSTKTDTILMYALIFGFFFPLVIIYLIGLFNTKIETVKDLEPLANLPVISEMAHSDSKQNFAVTETGLDSTTELFRLLRTKLNFILEHPKEKIILVTSTEPGEGKTFISLNLALSLAMTNKSVLLVGLDLRKPQLAEKFGITRKEGITSFLSHQEEDINTLITQSTEYPNLHILPSGIIPPNPNELLMKDELGVLFQQFRNRFDYIILDSAPVGVVSDTLLLMPHADITLFVCRAGFTDKKSMEIISRLADDQLTSRTYLILNDLSMNKKHYKYKYRYGYGYGYGYGYKARPNKDV